MNTTSDVLVIGAGAIGTAIAFFATQQGLSVTVLDRGAPGCGTTSACEGNILISDKALGPELELMQYSLKVWRGDLAEHGHLWEFDPKGGIIVASQNSSMVSLQRLMAAQSSYGIQVQSLDPHELKEREPHVTPSALGAASYPEDCQVQPMLLAANLLRLACQSGAQFVSGAQVTSLLRDGDRVIGAVTPKGRHYAGAVVNASGTWASQIADLAGVAVPVKPRRGYVLVTEPLPPMVHHKVYAAEYVDSVNSSDESLQASPVVEGTPSGNILIGSSRERVGFDHTVNLEALKLIAANAVALFPFLSEVKIIRYYHGFRPYCPDHLPVLGHDPRAPGLWHACGHEGAGIGLSAATGKLLAQALADQPTDLDLGPFAPQRFGEVSASSTSKDTVV